MAAHWTFAVPDWRERIEAGKSLLPTLPIDQAEYERATAIFDKLRLPDVVGKPALKDAGGEWFRQIVGTVLGSVDKDTGERQVPELFLLAPKKSSKTSNGAAFMITGLLLNERPRAEFLMVAPSLAIAHLAFTQAIGMIEADETGFLRRRMHVQEHLRKITDRRTKASLAIKTFDASILTGIKPAGVLLDELHEIAKSAAAERIIGQIRGGMIAVPEAFFAMITTQSDQPPRGAFAAELNNARGIRDGRTGGRTLSVLYEFPERFINDKTVPPIWWDSKYWWMVTPNLGKSVTLAKLEETLDRAQRDGPHEVIRWASQHLNIEIGLALGSNRWAGAEFWQKGMDRSITLDALLDRCEAVVPGIDGGGLDDLFGLTLIGRDRETKDWLSWSHAWCHKGVLERRKSIASQLLEFQARGELTIVDDELGDVSAIVEIVADVKARGLLAGVAVDPAGLGEFVDALAEIGVTVETKLLWGAPQGFALMNAIKTTERKLASGTFRHAASKLMAWCVGNLKIEPTATAIRATKQNAGDAKIDPVMALFNAAWLMATNPQPAQEPKFQMLIL